MRTRNRFLPLFVAFPLSLSVPAAQAQELPAPVKFDQVALRQTPTVTPGTTTEPGVKALYYSGLPYKGTPTQTFAYYGVPSGQAPASGWPGVVLLHGGGGTAYADWVRRWNAAGFAAISMDLEGREPESGNPQKRKPTPQPGPSQAGVFGDSNLPLETQFPYFAVSQAVLANSLLRSFPEVNKDKIGLCGISWGSVWTCITVGVDDRFAFAIPIYGHGFLTETDGQVNINALKQPAGAVWEPSLYLKSAKAPMFFVASTNDRFFSPKPWQKSIDIAGAGAQELLIPGLAHSQGDAAAVNESYEFAKQVVNKVKSNPLKLTGATVQAPETPAKADFVYTLDSGLWVNRLWRTAPATLNGQNLAAPLNINLPRVTASYFLLTRADGTRISSPVTFNTTAETDAKPRFALPGDASKVVFKDDFTTAETGAFKTANGWEPKGTGVTVEAAEGRGNIVTLKPPYSELSRSIPEAAQKEIAFVRFAVKATPPGAGGAQASEQMLVYLRDTNDKQLALMWHSGTGQWGVFTNKMYVNRSLPGATDPWTDVEVSLDSDTKKISIKLKNAGKETVLFENVNFTNTEADRLAKITFTRTKDGNAEPIGLDDVSVLIPTK